ncbi:MAG: tyrosine-type recombinase/integrase [Rhodoferax sp.]
MATFTKIGSKWRALVRRKGQKPQCKTFAIKAQAEAWARQIESDIDRGLVAVDPVSLTMKQVIQAYHRLRESSRPVADTSNEHYVLKRLTEGLGDKSAGALTPQALADYCKMRKEDGAGPYTINLEISKLGTVMRYAGIALGVVLPDAAGAARPLLNHLGLIGGGSKRERRPTEDEITAILKALAARGQVYADAVEFAAITAARRGEVCAVKWADFDEKTKMLIIRDRKDPKKKKGNDDTIPLLGKSFDIVMRQERKSDKIFPIHPQTLSKYFTEVCRALAIPDLHLHDFRHEGTSALFEQGYTIEQVSLVTGHKSWANLKRYTNLKPESLHRE